jgi:hypothetical protein
MSDPLRYKTIAEAARAAIDVQDAVNASGVALSMFEVSRTIRARYMEESTPGWEHSQGVNKHPAMQLFGYKLNALTMGECLCVDCGEAWSKALIRCKGLAGIEV